MPCNGTASMDTLQPEAATYTIVTATGVETAAARSALPRDARVVQAGVALRRRRQHIDGIAISCGLAGGLRADLPTGTVLVPRELRLVDGTVIACDPLVAQMLAAAARAQGYRCVQDPLLTAAAVLRGRAREMWAQRGCAGVDMESGFIDASGIACVRVVLDTPQREISPAWERPARALIFPAAWRDLPFLAREGPRCARIAARVIARALF